MHFSFLFSLFLLKSASAAVYKRDVTSSNSISTNTALTDTIINKDVTVTELYTPSIVTSVAQVQFVSIVYETGDCIITSNNKIDTTHIDNVPATVIVNQFPTTLTYPCFTSSTVTTITETDVPVSTIVTYVTETVYASDCSESSVIGYSVKPSVVIVTTTVQQDSNLNNNYYVSNCEIIVTTTTTTTVTSTNKNNVAYLTETCIPITSTLTSKTTIYYTDSTPANNAQSNEDSVKCDACVTKKIVKTLTLTSESIITTSFKTTTKIITKPITYTTLITSLQTIRPAYTSFSVYTNTGPIPSAYTTFDSITCSCSVVIVPIPPYKTSVSYYTSSGTLPAPYLTTNSIGSTIVVVPTRPVNTLSSSTQTFTGPGPIPPPTVVVTTDSIGSTTSIYITYVQTFTSTPSVQTSTPPYLTRTITLSGSIPPPTTVTTTDSVGSTTTVIITYVETNTPSTITETYTSTGPLPPPTTVTTTNSVGSTTTVIITYVETNTPSTITETYTSSGPLPPPTTVVTTNSVGSTTTVIITYVETNTPSTITETYTSSGPLPPPTTVVTTNSVGSTTTVIITYVETNTPSTITETYTSSGPLPPPTTVVTTNSVGSTTTVIITYVETNTPSTITETYTSSGPLPPPTTVMTTNSVGSTTTIIITYVSTTPLSTSVLTFSGSGPAPPIFTTTGTSTTYVVSYTTTPLPSWVTTTSTPTTPYSFGYTTSIPPVGTTPGSVIIVPPPLSTITSIDTNTGSLPGPYTTSNVNTTIVIIPVRPTVTVSSCLSGIPGVITYTRDYVSNAVTVDVIAPIYYSTSSTGTTYSGTTIKTITSTLPLGQGQCTQYVRVVTEFPSDYVSGCSESGPGVQNGLNASYYSWVSPAGYGAAYNAAVNAQYPNDYVTQKPISTATGITEVYIPNGDGTWDPTRQYFTNYENIFKMRVFVNNFTIVLQGYLYIPETGTYNLGTFADNAGWLYVGTGANQAFQCCSNTVANVDNDPALTVRSSTAAYSVTNKEFYFTAGEYVPFRFVWTNHGTSYGTSITVTFPNGTSTRNLDGLLYGRLASC